jgi:hypothetical protein
MIVEIAGKTDWQSWIERFRNTTLKTYENEPDRIREDFGSELRVSDDYKGRALLELLQNADDAQQPESEVTASIGSREVVFSLTRKAFYCANGGYTMTRQGLNSICRLSHSPKDRSRLTIGEKGLGFKSVLSFSKSPEIHSGDLHCRFDRQGAFEFISGSVIIMEKKPDLTHDKVPLLRVPIWSDSSLWECDPILVELAQRYATIIKLPILEKDFDVIRGKLEDIKPPILLFLNFLETIEIRVDGEASRRCCIVREKHIQYDSCEVARSLLEGEKEDTSWCTIKGAFDVPEDKLEGLAHSWENVKKCGVAFAMQESKAGYALLDKSFDNSVRVFFPTNESFPLPLLFHATYYADSARKSINIEHSYNQFLTEKAADFFVSSVIPRLVDRLVVDPCAHLDLLIRSSQREKTVGAYFGDLLFQALSETNIIPDSKGILRKPKELKQLPFDTAKWKEWYSFLGEEGCDDLRLVHIDCREPDRFELLRDLGVEPLSFKEVINSLETHVVKDAVWFSEIYQAINEYGQTKFGEDRKNIDRICEKSRLLFTSDNEVVSSDDIKVFMPPESENIGTVPKWLNTKFVHPEVVKALGQNREQVLNTVLDRFGVKRFQIRDILREVLSAKLDEYWEGENSSLVPINLLRFLFDLVGQELGDRLIRPEKLTFSILLKVPVPAVDPSGKLHWTKAGETYFSHHWLGNNFLEKLYNYDPNSRFVCSGDYFMTNGFSSDNIYSFLYYLGVENQPRLLEATNISEMRGFVDHECYDEYLRSNDLTAWTYGGSRHDLDYDCTVDRIEAIMRIPERSRTLLNYMARNSYPYLITGDAKYKHYYYTWNPDYLKTNYLKWILQNFSWLYDSHDEGHKPNEIYVPYRSLIQRFSNYVHYVSWDSEEGQASWQDIRGFLLKIGVKDNLEEFNPEQWYGIISKIPGEWADKNITEEDAERIRAIYREFLRSIIHINDEGKKFKDDFVKSGKLLAFYSGKYSFYPVQEVFYVDRLDLFYELKDFVPCFQIETNREQRVEELFSVPSLSTSLAVIPDIGSNDPTLEAPLNAFLRDAKPFLLARVRSRRDLKTDVSQVRSLVINPVTRITVQRTVRHPSTIKEVVIPNTEVDSVLIQEEQEGSKYWAMYIDARRVKRGVSNYMQFRHDDDLISTLSNRLSEMLKIDLSEAFQLILSKEAYSRRKILQDNHIDEELLQECYGLLSQQEEEQPEEEQVIAPPPPPEEEPQQEIEPTPVPGPAADVPKPHVLWGEGNEKMDYEELGEEAKKTEVGGKLKPKTPEPHVPKPPYPRDPELRKRIDDVGMKRVMDYERSIERIPDDSPCKQRGGPNRTGPGCDIYSTDSDGRLIRRIEVKSSLNDEFESVELTRTELETARNSLTGQDFYIYRVIKLDKEKYPEGPEVLIFHDPYKEGIDKAIPVSIRFNLENLKYDRIRIAPSSS